MFTKQKRVVDKKLLAEVRTRPCIICGITPSDAHHLKHRGSGGGDTAENLVALCRWHHAEVHQIGPSTFKKKYSLN